MINGGVAACGIRADVDEVLIAAVKGHCLACFASEFNLFTRAKIAGQTAHAVQHVYGGIMVLRGKVAGEDDVAVENGAHGVGDGVVHVVLLNECGVEAGDAAALACAGAFEELREHGEDGGGVAASGGGLADGQADLALGHGKAGDGVHHEEDVLALIAEVFGDGGGGKRAFDAGECGLVGGGYDDDGAGAAGVVEVFFEEFADFASAFADEGDDVDVGFGAAGDHAEEGGFADAAAGKDAEALAAAAGGEGVDGFDAGLEYVRDALAFEGVWGEEVDAGVVVCVEGAESVEGAAEAVDDAAE